jgi:hypothetical protein
MRLSEKCLHISDNGNDRFWEPDSSNRPKDHRGPKATDLDAALADDLCSEGNQAKRRVLIGEMGAGVLARTQATPESQLAELRNRAGEALFHSPFPASPPEEKVV